MRRIFYGIIFLLVVGMVVGVQAVNFTPEITGDSVHYNVTTRIDTSTATPFDIWVLAAILGLILFFWTIIGSASTTIELERDAVVSVLAWIPIGFTAYTAFAVERITSAGVVATENSGIVLLENHIIYHFDTVGIIYGILFVVAIVNTFRILALHKSLTLEAEAQSRPRFG